MDFSKKGTLKKQHQVKSTAVRMSSKATVMTYRIVVLLIAAAAVISCIAVAGAVNALIKEVPELEDINVISVKGI